MPTAPPRGRLDEARTREIYSATADLLVEVGYDHLTMDAVAARAKASKATLYRRWDGKAELVVEALGTVGEQASPLPDTGELRTDLREFLMRVSNHGSQPQVCLMRGLVSACATDAVLATTFRSRLVETKRNALLSLFERARDRGQIAPDRDLEFLVDVLPASLMFRFLVTYEPVDHDFIDRLVDEVALPLLAPRTNQPGPTSAGAS